ncbi:hypothetical protein ACIQ6V_31180 [Streptomyces sp. NPDC096198]|uniref:hypothetical protein n=1 Tax=Streptomyces sp. NPDC096198 TaxID=3366080 RepID=UPI0038164F48
MQGAQGAPTPALYTIRGPQAVPTVVGVGSTSTATCLPGDVATGGGFDTFGLHDTLNVIENAPTPNSPGPQGPAPKGWQTQASLNVLGGGFQAYAVCQDLP